MVAVDPYRAPQPARAPAPAPVICRQCGVVAPARAANCELCKRSLAETRIQAPSLGPDFFWVAVRCGFACNSCRFLAPLDGLDVDGAVDCAQCGLRQRFDVPLWSKALELVHDVGDLAGPQPEGRVAHPAIWIGGENPYKAVGDTKTFEDLGTIEGGMLEVQAAPGHPVCSRCKLPLAVTLGAQGTVTTQCSTCGDRATWQMPASAVQLYDRILAVISDDHRTDRQKALSNLSGGALALKCPGCGAPLTLQGEDRLQTCPFCRASCLVPMRRLHRLRNEVPEPEVWWVLLRGPSNRRLQLETPGPGQPGPALEAAKQLIKRSDGPSDIADTPGVYEAPVPPGPNWPQIAFTIAAGMFALTIGYLIAGR